MSACNSLKAFSSAADAGAAPGGRLVSTSGTPTGAERAPPARKLIRAPAFSGPPDLILTPSRCFPISASATPWRCSILTLAALRSSPLDWITKLNAAILAGWTNLVLTAVVLSFGSALGQPVLFAAVSTVIAVGSALLLAGAGLMPATPGKPLVSFLEDRPRLARLLLAFFVITGAGVLLGNLIIALAYLAEQSSTR